MLDEALDHARRGWPIFPCAARGKRPLTKNGFKDATRDEDQIRVWWAKWPRANVAVPTGAATFDVLDIDGPEGERSLDHLEAAHGDLPAGPRQHTGRGRHVFFRGGTLPTSAGRLKGIDTRGDGGYVIVDPSIHENGEQYVLEDADEPLPEPPEWLTEAIGGPVVRHEPDLEPVAVSDENAEMMLQMAGIPARRVPEGKRNVQLFKWGCSMRARGMEAPTILRMLALANIHLCDPSLPEDEILKIARSAASKEVSATYRRAEEVADRVAEREVERATREREQLEESREREERREAIENADLTMLREVLGVPLRRVIQMGVDPACYFLEFDGDPKRMPVKNLLSWGDIRTRIFDRYGVVISVPQKEWPAAAVALRRIAEQEDPGLADEDAEVLDLMHRYVDSSSADEIEHDAELWKRQVENLPVIIYAPHVYIRHSHFRQWCERNGLPGRGSDLWRRLKKAGLSEAERNIPVEGGGRVTRRYWRIHYDAPRMVSEL